MRPSTGGRRQGVEHIKNPILPADTVRPGSRHVMSAGYEAELYASPPGPARFFIRQVVGHEISAAMEYGGMPFNTEGMYRGYVTTNGEVVTKIFADE